MKSNDKNGINKQNTYINTKHSEKDNIGKGYLLRKQEVSDNLSVCVLNLLA